MINIWKQGQVLTYLKYIIKRFMFETTQCNKKLTNIYINNFIEFDELEVIEEQNYHLFM